MNCFVHHFSRHLLRGIGFRGKFLLPVCCLLALSSCSIEKHIARKTEEMAKQLSSEPLWEQLAEERITWDKAVEMAMKNNLQIKQGELAIVNAEYRVQEVFTNFIPGVNLDSLLTKDISSLGTLSGSDVEYRANILFNIPSLTQIPYTYYSAKASLFQAKQAMIMKRREVLSQLFKASREYMLAEESYKMELQSVAFDDDGKQRQKIEEDWAQKSKGLSSSVAALVGNIDKRWVIREDTVPRIDWTKYKKASQRLDNAVLGMMAMELEAARLNIIGIKMRYFPELNINFYSPSLFSSSGGTYGGFFSGSGDTMVNMSLSMRLDTRLTVWHQLKSAKASYELLTKEIRIRMIERREKVKSLIASREEFESWGSFIRKKSAFLSSLTPQDSEEYKKNSEEASNMLKEVVRQEMRNTDTEAALILEYGLL